MTFSEFFGGGRRSRSKSSMGSRTFRPQVETLEVRYCPAVTAPTGLALTALSPTQVQATWNPVAGDLGYRIFEWNGTQTTAIGQVTAKTTSFTATQLTPYHQYYFTVEAFDSSTTAYSAWVSIITPRNVITAPTNVLVKPASSSQLTLTWTASTGETGYHILQWNGSTWVQVGGVTAGVNIYTVGGLSAGQNYSFQVQAYNATNTATSAVVNGTTIGVNVTAVSNLTIQVLNANTMQLNWKNGAGETGYRVYRWDATSQTNTIIATLAAGTTSYQDANLQGSTTYWYYIQAFNAANYANSAWVNATTPAAAPLKAPANFAGLAVGANSVELTWNLSVGAAGYRIYEWNGYTWQLNTTVAQGVQQFVINDLESSETHWFLVQAFAQNNTQVANTDPVFVNL